MREGWNEAESYEEREFTLEELEKEPQSDGKRTVLAVLLGLAVFAGLFLACTAPGRGWTRSGSALMARVFAETFGLQASSETVKEISADSGDSAELVGVAADSEADVASDTASGTVLGFPLTLPQIEKPTQKTVASTIKASKSAVPSSVHSVLTPSASTTSQIASTSPPTNAFPVHVMPPQSTTASVSVMFTGDGRGYVSSTPTGIACDGSGTCAWGFPVGMPVTLRATHDALSGFGGWTGACSGLAAACVLTVGGPMTVTVAFKLAAMASISGTAAPIALESAVAQTTGLAPDDTSTFDLGTGSSSVDADMTASSAAEISKAAAVGHMVIMEIQIAGDTSDNDFVRLANPTGGTVDMSGWKLHKRSKSGADYSLKTFAKGTAITAGGTLLWANSENGFADLMGADVSSTQTLAPDNSVALLDVAGNVVDAVAWGNGASQYGEGPPFPTDPGANQVLARRAADGTDIDTDDNATDFEFK